MQFQPNTEGAFYGLDEPIYRQAPGINQSLLKPFERSPAHYKQSLADKHEPTPQMVLGTLVHLLVLEGGFGGRVIEKPDVKRPSITAINAKRQSDETKERIEFWAKFDKEAEGRILATREQIDIAESVTKSIQSHKAARAALCSDGEEVSLFANLETEHGIVLRKCRIDKPNGNCIVDIKTTTDARDFERTLWTYKYHRQAAYYLDIWNAVFAPDFKENFVFIIAETEPPFGVIVRQLDAEAIERGRDEYRTLLRRFAKCVAEDYWPCYDDEIRTIGLPKWA